MKTTIETISTETLREYAEQNAARLDSNRITLDAAAGDLEGVINAIPLLCAGLQEVAYNYTLTGILQGMANPVQHNTTHENALAFVEAYYTLTAGAIDIIGAAASLVSNGLSNGDIEIRATKGARA